jgi:glycine cleavage system H protein
VWARIEASGQVRVGLDDFARKALGSIDRVELPAESTSPKRGDPIFSVHHAGTVISFLAPISGTVAEVNKALLVHPHWLGQSPYDGGWVCMIDPLDLVAELTALRIGKPVVDWYQDEIVRLRGIGGMAVQGAPQVEWRRLQEEFFTPRPGALKPRSTDGGARI